MKESKYLSRREFLAGTGVALAGSMLAPHAIFAEHEKTEPIIDIHQHTNYSGRTPEQLIAHQKAMGITTTILLPAGTPAFGLSTHMGKSNGLQVQATGNKACYEMAKQYPREFVFGSNEVPDLEDAPKEIEKYLKLGACVIGEVKFGLDCDSAPMQKLYQLAGEYKVPVLLHWQFQVFTYGYDRFYKMLEKYPKTNFIGHAQSWWANIDKNHLDQSVLYPKGKVTPGGMTDRLLSDYPNMYGDLSAGSGLNSMTRDEEHARAFLKRHQDKVLYGSDCNDHVSTPEVCQGYQTVAAVKRLSETKAIERKILYKNAKKLFRL